MKPLFLTAIIGTPADQHASDNGRVSVGDAPMQITMEYGASGSDELSKKDVIDCNSVLAFQITKNHRWSQAHLVDEVCFHALIQFR